MPVPRQRAAACACAHGMLARTGQRGREHAGHLFSPRAHHPLHAAHTCLIERNLNAPVQPFEDPEHMKNAIALAFDYRAGTSPAPPTASSSAHIHFGNIQQINDDGSGRTTIVESEPRLRFLPRNSGWGGPGPDSGQGCRGRWLTQPCPGSEFHLPWRPDKQPVNPTACY